MGSRQDSSHPTGVASDAQLGGGRHVSDPALLPRNRKASAALALRMSGVQWSDIALTLGYPTPRAAMLATEKALVKHLEAEEDKVKMRTMAGARLERLLRAVWNRAIDTNDPEQFTAVSRARELIQDHSKLFGLQAPSEVVVHTPTQTELEEWVLRMTATMVPDAQESDIWEGEVVEEREALGA